MDVRRTQSKISVETISDLPTKWQLHPAFYNDPEHQFYVTSELRKKIAVLEGRSSDTHSQSIYIVYTGQAQYVRALVKHLAESKNDINVVIASTRNERLFEAIYNNSNVNDLWAKGSGENSHTQSQRAFAENLLVNAMRLGASDFHLESDGQNAVMRFRIYKELIDYEFLTHNQAEQFASTCFQTFTGSGDEEGTGDGVYKANELLEGEFSLKVGDVSLKARMVNLSHNRGDKFDFIARLIDRNKNSKAATFEELNFSENTCRLMRTLETASSGAILILGVTGSGKSTTQHNLMQHERDRTGSSRKQISLESPVEYELERITQVTVADPDPEKLKTKANDFSFSNLNRYLLRSDPDSITYGELRDQESAEAAAKGTATGHLCYATMHTDSAMSAFSRLQSLGVQTADICRPGFLRLAMFQHLLPKLCPHCSIDYQLGDKIPDKYDEMFALKSFAQAQGRVPMSRIYPLQENLKPGESLLRKAQTAGIVSAKDIVTLREKLKFLNNGYDNEGLRQRILRVVAASDRKEEDVKIKFRGQGCSHCFRGQKGVVPASEVLIPDSKFLEYIKNGDVVKAEIYWKSALGGLTASEDCLDKLFDGEVDPRTVEEELKEIGS